MFRGRDALFTRAKTCSRAWFFEGRQISIRAQLRGSKGIAWDASAKVVLPISIGQSYHEGSKLDATLNLVARRFSSCDILVADTLQRFNAHSEGSYSKTLHEGNEWIARNQEAIDKYGDVFKVIRWDECTSHPWFMCEYNKLLQSATSDREFSTILEADIARVIGKYPDIPKENIKSYLLEELAVFCSFFIDHHYAFVIYPGSPPHLFHMLQLSSCKMPKVFGVKFIINK